MLCHSDLALYYNTVFALAQHHKYQISEIENLIPYERDFYLALLIDYLKQLEEKNRAKHG
jgi:hypothetical protein